MPALFALIMSLFAPSAAQAHEALVPHTHPHGVSMLPGLETSLVALLVLAVAAFAVARFRRG